MSEAQTAKLEAIERVEQNNKVFVEAAFIILKQLASEQEELSSLDVWKMCQGLPFPHHPRAMGPVFMRASRMKLISATNRWVKSGRESDHNQDLRIWRSNIYKEAA